MKHSFKMDIKKLAVWKIFSQTSKFFYLLILTQFFTEKDFGILSEFLSISSIGLSFWSLRIEWYIPNEKKMRNALNLAIQAVVPCCFFSIFFLFSGSINIVNYYFKDINTLCIVFYINLIALESIIVSLMVKSKNVGDQAIPKFLKEFFFFLFSLIFIKIGFNDKTLILTMILSYFIYVLILGREFWFVLFEALMRFKLSYKKFFYVKYFSSSVVSSVNTFSTNIAPLLIIKFYGAEIAGIYFLIQRFIFAPIDILSTSISSAYWSVSACEMHEDSRLALSRYKKYTSIFFILSFICAILVTFICLLVVKFFGTYLPLTYYKVMANIPYALPMVIGSFCFGSLGHLIVLGKHHYQLFPDILRIFLTFLSVFLCAKLEISFYYCILFISLSSLFSHIFLFFIHLLVYERK